MLKTRHSSSATRQSAEILAALEAHPAFRAATTVLLYHSLKDEVDTHEFIRKWSREKRILLPVVVGDDLELRLYTGPEDLKPGAYGIEEPTGELFTDYADIDFIVFPAWHSTVTVTAWGAVKVTMTGFCPASHQPTKPASASRFNS